MKKPRTKPASIPDPLSIVESMIMDFELAKAAQGLEKTLNDIRRIQDQLKARILLGRER